MVQKRARQDMEESGNTDSSRQDTSCGEDDDSKGIEVEQDEEEDDANGRVILAIPLYFS